MNNQIKNFLIGLFVIVACLLFVGLILFIEPSVGDGKQVLKVRFTNINGLSVGSKVMLGGRAIGEVAEIQIVPHAREKATQDRENVYLYQLTLRIDSRVHVFITDEISTQTSGLLGEKSINIVPKPIKPGTMPRIISESDIIYADPGDMWESAFGELSELSDKLGETLDRVTNWMDRYGDITGSTIKSVGYAAKEFGEVFESLNEEKIVLDIKRAVNGFASVFEQADIAITELINDKFFTNLSATALNVKDVTQQIAEGKGTIGKLIQDDFLYLQMNAMITKVDNLLFDINNYGLLFNTNKQWQRVNQQRQVRADKVLKDPSAFRQQLESEMRLINGAMDRVENLAEKAQGEKTEEMLNDPRFQKSYRELMREVEQLYENVRLYNQKMQEILSDG